MKAGIAVDNWKLPVFRKRLTEAGYQYTDAGGLTHDTTLLTVECSDILKLKKVMREWQELRDFKAHMQSDAMVERVAKALALLEHRMGDTLPVAMSTVNRVWPNYTPQARAVLSALGEHHAQ
jgi:hypothetical protein